MDSNGVVIAERADWAELATPAKRKPRKPRVRRAVAPVQCYSVHDFVVGLAFGLFAGSMLGVVVQALIFWLLAE